MGQQEHQLSEEEYQLEEEDYATMEEHKNSNQGDDGADRFERKLNTLITLMIQLVQQQQKGQRKYSRSPIHGDCFASGWSFILVKGFRESLLLTNYNSQA